jgi:hypothetical protein
MFLSEGLVLGRSGHSGRPSSFGARLASQAEGGTLLRRPRRPRYPKTGVANGATPAVSLPRVAGVCFTRNSRSRFSLVVGPSARDWPQLGQGSP